MKKKNTTDQDIEKAKKNLIIKIKIIKIKIKLFMTKKI